MIFATYIKEKLEQSYKLLQKHKLDCWIIYSQGSDNLDPALNFFNGGLKLREEVLILIFKNFKIKIFTGEENFSALKSLGYRAEEIYLLNDLKVLLKTHLKEENVKTLALNKSERGYGSGINHALYQKLLSNLNGLDLVIEEAGPLVYSLTLEQTPGEKRFNRELGFELLKVHGLITQNLGPGWTFKSLISLLKENFQQAKLEFSEFFSNDLFLSHGQLKRGFYNLADDPLFEPGYLLNLFLGLKNLNTHIFSARSWYILKPGETKVPHELEQSFQKLQALFNQLILTIQKEQDYNQVLISLLEQIEDQPKQIIGIKYIGAQGHYTWTNSKPREADLKQILDLKENQLFYLELTLETQWGLLQQGETISIEGQESKFLIPPQKQIWAVQWFDDEQIREVIDK